MLPKKGVAVVFGPASALAIIALASACSSDDTNGNLATDGGDDSSPQDVAANDRSRPADSSAAADSSDGSASSCTPKDTSSYKPGTFVPSRAHQGLCTGADISSFVSACGDKGTQSSCNTWIRNNTHSDAGPGTACGNCILAPDNSGGTWTDPQGFFSANYGGCIQLTDSTNGAACGAAFDAVFGCEGDSCDPCSASDYGACQQAADQAGCKQYQAQFQTSCAADLSDGGAFATCMPGGGSTLDPDFTYIVTLICGDADGGAADAASDSASSDATSSEAGSSEAGSSEAGSSEAGAD